MTSYPDTGDYGSDEPVGDPPRKSDDTPCRPCASDPDDCDSHSLAKVRCQADGIEAQAAFNKEFQPPLDAAQETYAAARNKYRQTRADVACDVRDLRHEISCLIERIRCLIKQEHVVKCLDDAFDCVVDKLRECNKRTWELDCDYNTHCDDLPLEAVTQRIVEYKAKFNAAKDRFAWLVGEPDRLKARVDAAKAEVKAVEDALKADPAVTDPKKLYVQAIVAWYHLKIVWGGFRTVSKYIDTLCAALTCWRDGVVAVSRLVRLEAELKCHRDAKDKECDRLRLQTVDEILVVYEQLCGHSSHDECDDDDDHHDECDDDDDHHHGHDHDHGDDHDHEPRRSDDDDDEPPPDRGEDRGRSGSSERYRGDNRGRYGNDRDDDMGYRRRTRTAD